MSTSASTESAFVLVTGASGFLGAHVVEQLLGAGYRVRCTARGLKARFLETAHASYGSRFTVVEVEDLVDVDLGHVLEDIEAIIHVAFPAPGSMESTELLLNGVNSTTNLLRQAYQHGIHKFVLTSSYLAVVGLHPENVWRDYTFTDRDWSDATYEEAFDGSRDPSWVYAAAKKLAEAAAWDFVRSHPEMDLATVIPTVLLGPFAPGHAVLSSADLSTNVLLHALLDPDQPPPHPIWPHFVDVRDAARMHVLVLEMAPLPARLTERTPTSIPSSADELTLSFAELGFRSPGRAATTSVAASGEPRKRILASGASFTWDEALCHLRPGHSASSVQALPQHAAGLDVHWTGGQGPDVTWRAWRETLDDARRDLERVARQLERSGWEELFESGGDDM